MHRYRADGGKVPQRGCPAQRRAHCIPGPIKGPGKRLAGHADRSPCYPIVFPRCTQPSCKGGAALHIPPEPSIGTSGGEKRGSLHELPATSSVHDSPCRCLRELNPKASCGSNLPGVSLAIQRNEAGRGGLADHLLREIRRDLVQSFSTYEDHRRLSVLTRTCKRCRSAGGASCTLRPRLGQLALKHVPRTPITREEVGCRRL